MGGIGINEKELRRGKALVRMKSKELKVMDAGSLLGPLSHVLINGKWPDRSRGGTACEFIPVRW